MDSFNWELLDSLMNLYLGVGIFLLILAVISIGYIIYRVATYLMDESDKANKNNIKQAFREILKEKENEEK